MEKRTRSRDEDVPIIGDYSEAQDARLSAETRDARAHTPPHDTAPPDSHATEPAAAPPAFGRPAQSGGTGTWRLDPGDVARHAKLRRQREQRGPFGKAARYCAVVLVLAGAFAVYWNFDTLRQLSIEAPALSALLKSLSSDDTRVPTRSAPDTAQVESTAVAGTAAPTSVGAARDRAPLLDVAKAESLSPDTAPAAPPASAADSVTAAPVIVEQPAVPPTPETIAFALPKVTVSERDASAAVLVVRSGGNRGASSFTWWTSDGTAKAGSDYVDLGKVVVKFAAGEVNHAIHIPIVGDAVAEGLESFYVNLAPGDDASAEAQDRVEVVIEDDD